MKVYFSCLHMYVIQFYSLFDDFMKSSHPGITDYQLSVAKQHGFSRWLLDLVRADYRNTLYPLWLHELARGPIRRSTCWNKYFSRGYIFHTVQFGENRATTNYGVCVRGSSGPKEAYYGKLHQIIQIAYHGAIGLKVMLFRCVWFDTTCGSRTRMHKPGVVEVLASGRYAEYDPFIPTTQADQVCFLRYPQLIVQENEWLVVVKVTPRGAISESSKQQDAAVQEDDNEYIIPTEVGVLNINSLVMPGGQLEDIPEDPNINSDDEYGSDVELT
ncbi:unnamed protein product [Thlaspi arvense]|uniref:DUF4216 domain-containing protein n=1 Tax=Thlaspi arvense TaxID=13288 RepID=A0AAU9RDQ9_THLAR|nr:unnamed protein product [Thlaspi arvense]